MQQYEIVAIGTGSVNESSSREVLQRWHRTAIGEGNTITGAQGDTRQRRSSGADVAAFAASMGFTIKRAEHKVAV